MICYNFDRIKRASLYFYKSYKQEFKVMIFVSIILRLLFFSTSIMCNVDETMEKLRDGNLSVAEQSIARFRLKLLRKLTVTFFSWAISGLKLATKSCQESIMQGDMDPVLEELCLAPIFNDDYFWNWNKISLGATIKSSAEKTVLSFTKTTNQKSFEYRWNNLFPSAVGNKEFHVSSRSFIQRLGMSGTNWIIIRLNKLVVSNKRYSHLIGINTHWSGPTQAEQKTR